MKVTARSGSTPKSGSGAARRSGRQVVGGGQRTWQEEWLEAVEATASLAARLSQVTMRKSHGVAPVSISPDDHGSGQQLHDGDDSDADMTSGG